MYWCICVCSRCGDVYGHCFYLVSCWSLFMTALHSRQQELPLPTLAFHSLCSSFAKFLKYIGEHITNKVDFVVIAYMCANWLDMPDCWTLMILLLCDHEFSQMYYHFQWHQAVEAAMSWWGHTTQWWFWWYICRVHSWDGILQHVSEY